MNGIIQKSGRAKKTGTKLRAKIFAIFCIANYASKNLQKFTNGKIRHYSFKMADNDLQIW